MTVLKRPLTSVESVRSVRNPPPTLMRFSARRPEFPEVATGVSEPTPPTPAVAACPIVRLFPNRRNRIVRERKLYRNTVKLG